MGRVNRRAFVIDILRYGGEFLITVSLSFFLFGLLFGVWEELVSPFQGYLPLLIPIIYVNSRAVLSLHRLYQQLADLVQGPRTLVGYVTLHDEQTLWRRGSSRNWAWREPVGHRLVLNIVPADSFARWLGKPEWQIRTEATEAEFRFDPDPTALSRDVIEQAQEASGRSQVYRIHPITLQAPRWAFEMVRLGDLIRITYARRTGRIYNVQVLLSVMMPE